MSPRTTPLLGKIPATILLCAMLAACSTTQKSSTSTQEAAPISEAGKPDAGKPADAVTTTQGSSSATQGGAATAGSTGAAAAAGKGDEEAARLKKQLADQEAEINRVRDEQVNAQKLADEEAARRRAAESGTSTAGASSQQGSSSGEAAAAAGTGAAGAGSSSQQSAGTGSSGGAPAPGQPLQRSIYFDYDASTIPEQYDSMVVGHAAFLKANPDFDVEVQGNCDDRGSREYNIALGARRAEAVKKALELAGADGAKIKVVSFGSEKPVAFGQDEESYKQNRRADIQY